MQKCEWTGTQDGCVGQVADAETPPAKDEMLGGQRYLGEYPKPRWALCRLFSTVRQVEAINALAKSSICQLHFTSFQISRLH
jgi:hypothetical protein